MRRNRQVSDMVLPKVVKIHRDSRETQRIEIERLRDR